MKVCFHYENVQTSKYKKSRKIRKICQNLFNIQFDDFLTKNIKDEKFVNISNLTTFNKLKNLLNLIENSNFAI